MYTCVVAFKLFKWSEKEGGNRNLPSVVAPFKKTLSLMGAVFGFIFLFLLLIPASPAFMGIPSLITLVIWLVLGIGFYLYKGAAFNKIEHSEMNYLILGEGAEDHFKTGTDVLDEVENDLHSFKQ